MNFESISGDSSSVVATAAIVEDCKLLGELVLNHKLTHSEQLMPLVDQLLRMLELKPGDMDLFAVATGQDLLPDCGLESVV